MYCDLYVCLFVNPYFVFYPKAQHRNKLENESLIGVELSLALSGSHFALFVICGFILDSVAPHWNKLEVSSLYLTSQSLAEVNSISSSKLIFINNNWDKFKCHPYHEAHQWINKRTSSNHTGYLCPKFILNRWTLLCFS